MSERTGSKIFKHKGMPRNLIVAFNNRGWTEFNPEENEADEWKLYWDIGRDDWSNISLDLNKAYSRIETMIDLCSKNTLESYLNYLKKKNPNIYDFFPETYNPQENKEGYYICKPPSGSGGREIEITHNPQEFLSQKGKRKSYVIQQYLSNPKLIRGVKFDLRIYVLVTPHNPFKIWVYRNAMARFCSYKYNLNDYRCRYSHLTNTCVNQMMVDGYAPEKVEAMNELDEALGAREENIAPKWDTLNVFSYLERKEGISPSSLWKSIDEVIILTLVPKLRKLRAEKEFKWNCFELFGFDIIFDDKLKAYLLEINSNPSLAVDSKFDVGLKFPMMEGLVDLVDPDTKLSQSDINQHGLYEMIFNVDTQKLPFEN